MYVASRDEVNFDNVLVQCVCRMECMRSGVALNDIIIILWWTCRMRSTYVLEHDFDRSSSASPRVLRVQERDYSSLRLSLSTWSYYFVNTNFDGAVLSRYSNRTIMLDMTSKNGIIRVDLFIKQKNYFSRDKRKPQAARTYKVIEHRIQLLGVISI